MIQSIRYTRDLTLRIVTYAVGQSFATAARVETLDGELLHETVERPPGAERGAYLDALQWVRAQPIVYASGQSHMPPTRQFVGRRGSGEGYYIYSYRRGPHSLILRASRATEAGGEWKEGDPIPSDHVPEGALRKLGVLS